MRENKTKEEMQDCNIKVYSPILSSKIWNSVNKDCCFGVLGVTKRVHRKWDVTCCLQFEHQLFAKLEGAKQRQTKTFVFPRPSSHDIAHFRKLPCCDLEKNLTMCDPENGSLTKIVLDI